MISNLRNKRLDSILLLFVVWPFLSLIFAVINYRSFWAKNIVWFFTSFLGITFVISNPGMDANRYRERLIWLYENPVSFITFFKGISTGQYGRGDYLEPLLRYLVSNITSDHRILFGVFGLIFGYFFSRNVWFFIEMTRGKISIVAFPFILMMAFVVPFWMINGFRFWTATHIFIYGIIVLYNKKSLLRSIPFLMLSILTHITFIVPVAILMSVHFIHFNRYVLLVLLGGAILIIKLDINYLLNIIPDHLFGTSEIYIDGYLKSDQAENIIKSKANQRWFLTLGQLVQSYIYIFLSAFYLIYKDKKYNKTVLSSLMKFAIINLCIVNILSFVPSFGRFYALTNILICGVIFVVFQIEKNNKLNATVSFFSVPIFTLLILINFRIGFDFIGIGALINNPLLSFFIYIKLALVDIL